jgi:hypothetical protein
MFHFAVLNHLQPFICKYAYWCIQNLNSTYLEGLIREFFKVLWYNSQLFYVRITGSKFKTAALFFMWEVLVQNSKPQLYFLCENYWFKVQNRSFIFYVRITGSKFKTAALFFMWELLIQNSKPQLYFLCENYWFKVQNRSFIFVYVLNAIIIIFQSNYCFVIRTNETQISVFNSSTDIVKNYVSFTMKIDIKILVISGILLFFAIAGRGVDLQFWLISHSCF